MTNYSSADRRRKYVTTFAATLLLLLLSTSRSDEQPCMSPPENNVPYCYACGGAVGTSDVPTRTAIDQILDGLLTATSGFFKAGVYCDIGSWDGAVLYGYIYCPSGGDTTSCQEKLREAYAEGVEGNCGRYRVGAQVVTSDGSCLRYEKSLFCPYTG